MTTTMTTWVTELQDALGGDGVLTDPDVTAACVRDQAMRAPAGLSAAVVVPRSTEQVSAVVPLDVHRSIKASLDPAGSLDPGTVLRPAGPTADLVP